mgnify:FL=1
MNVTITSPFWKQRRDQIVESVIPYQWGVMNDEIATEVPDDPAGNQLADNKSHAVENLRIAAGDEPVNFMAWSSRIPTYISGWRKRLTHCRIILIRNCGNCAMKPSTSSRVRNNRTDIWTLRTKSKPVNGRIVSVSH